MPQQDKKTSENTEKPPKTWGDRVKAVGNATLGVMEATVGVGIMAATAVLTVVTIGTPLIFAPEAVGHIFLGGASLVGDGYQRVTNPYNNTKNDNSASQTAAVSSSQEEEEQRKKSRENHIQAQSSSIPRKILKQNIIISAAAPRATII